MKLIITDLEYRKAFDIFHIFKRKGYEIVAFSSKSSLERAILSVVYRQKVHRLRKDQNFTSDLYHVLKSDEHYVYFPVEEDTTLLFYDAADKKEMNSISFLLPKKETMELVRDKKVFSDFCISNHLPVPRAYDFETVIEMDQLPSPLIIKPRIGSGSAGIIFIDTKEELLSCKSLDFSRYLIQERLENCADIQGAFFLVDKGETLSYYGHKRLRTYPPKGGVSIYSKCEMNKELKKLGEEVLGKLEYSGIAMVEFLYDTKAQNYKIIEINPRAWGSIMLSEYCGVNILENYVHLALKEHIQKTKVEEECYIRWVFPWDLLGYIRQKGRIENFWKNEPNCCYINFTYAPKSSALLFTLYNIINPAKVGKFLEKVLR